VAEDGFENFETVHIDSTAAQAVVEGDSKTEQPQPVTLESDKQGLTQQEGPWLGQICRDKKQLAASAGCCFAQIAFEGAGACTADDSQSFAAQTDKLQFDERAVVVVVAAVAVVVGQVATELWLAATSRL